MQGPYIYWTDGRTNAIGRARIDGRDAEDSFIPDDGGALGDGHIYWSDVDDDSIGRANLDGGEVEDRFVGGAVGPDGVTVDGSHVYWVDNEVGTTTIGRANLDGSGAEQSFIADPYVPEDVAAGSGLIFWSNDFGPDSIGRARISGGEPEPSLITGAGEPYGVAVLGQYVYWTNLDSDTIARAARLGTSEVDESFITGAEFPTGVAVDGLFPPWRIRLTAEPAGSAGMPVTIEATADNPIAGTRDRLSIYARYARRRLLAVAGCRTSRCAGSISPPPPYPATVEVEAVAGPPGVKPFAPGALASRRLAVTVPFAPPRCTGSACM